MRYASMDHITMDNATLMSRIVQLEHERDELRRNADKAFTLQGGIFTGLDLVSRIHGRRSNELGHELESCERNLKACQKENVKLQEELSEVYSIKSKFAEQLKAETEKSASLEKEVKYFQNKVAAALSDRDRSLLEAQRLQKKRDGLIEKVTDLQDRLDHVTSEYAEEKGLCEVLYSKLEKLKEENDLHKKVNEKFWKVRQRARRTFGVEEIQDRAALLWQESEDLWHYGETELNLQNEGSQVQGEEELASCRASLANIQIEFEKEFSAREQAEVNLLCCKNLLFCLTELIGKELQELNLLKGSLKEEVFSFFSEEKNWILSLQDFLHLNTDVEQSETKKHASFNCLQKFGSSLMQEEISAVNTRSSSSSGGSSEDAAPVHVFIGSEDQFSSRGLAVALSDKEPSESFRAVEPAQEVSENPCQMSKFESKESVVEDRLRPLTNDSKALAQALQEKVAALLLLSQQEERHILESNTTFALESLVSSLKQQLVQVTSEKMDALVKLACAQERCLKLQETTNKIVQQDRVRTIGPLPAVAEPTVSTNGNENITCTSSRKALMQSYVKHLWSRGRQGLGVHASLSHMLSSHKSKEDDAVNDARSQRTQIQHRGSSSLQ